MGIDGISKPPGASIGSVGGAAGTEAPRSSEAFSVDRGGASTPAAPAERVSAALSGLQRGEISLDQYLDARVNEATSHLSGKVSAEQLDFVKQSLREQLTSDPVLVELVQRTTGSSPATERP
ncbi:MAG TPA: hypothetical protein VIM73_12725 [Polyangiaceae bacterium]